MNSSERPFRRIASNRLWTPCGVLRDPLVEVAANGRVRLLGVCPEPDRQPLTEFHAGLLVAGFPADYRAAFRSLTARSLTARSQPPLEELLAELCGVWSLPEPTRNALAAMLLPGKSDPAGLGDVPFRENGVVSPRESGVVSFRETEVVSFREPEVVSFREPELDELLNPELASDGSLHSPFRQTEPVSPSVAHIAKPRSGELQGPGPEFAVIADPFPVELPAGSLVVLSGLDYRPLRLTGRSQIRLLNGCGIESQA